MDLDLTPADTPVNHSDSYPAITCDDDIKVHRKQHDPELDALEDELLTLAAHINAATYRWIILLAEFDRRGG
jgi:hypothetical protein